MLVSTRKFMGGEPAFVANPEKVNANKHKRKNGDLQIDA